MKNARKKRPIDKLVQENYSWWRKTFVSIKKTKVRTWKIIFVSAFALGTVSAIAWSVFFRFHSASNAEGMASLKLDPVALTVKANDVFSVKIMLDTRGNDAVVVKAKVKYDKDSFELQGYDADSSDFVKKNKCLEAGKKCKVIEDKRSEGIFTVMLAKPRPGVNSSSDVVATLRFKALKDAEESENNISLVFKSGDSSGSDVVMDDGHGTNILADVKNSTVSVDTPACESFTYYDWSACNSEGKQTRTVLMSSPTGCAGGKPELEQDCTSTPVPANPTPAPTPTPTPAPVSTSDNKSNVGTGVACTQEVKICSDGSSVARQGVNCEFALCPGETAPTAGN